MAFSPISRAQDIMGHLEQPRDRVGDPLRGDIGFGNINFSTTINIFGGAPRGRATFGSGLMGGFSGWGFGIGGWFGGGRMTTGSFLGGMLGKLLGTAMNVGTAAAMSRLGGGYGGYRGGYGGSIFGGGYGAGYGYGTGSMLDHCYIRPGSTPVAGTGTQGTASTQGTSTSDADKADADNTSARQGTPSANPPADNNESSTTVTQVSSGNGSPTADYLRTYIEGEKGGNFISGDSTTRQNGETLDGSNNIKTWGDGTSKTANQNELKDAVKLGKADGTGDKEKDTSGYPKYFTMTDYRSHNEYTFVFSRTNNGHVYYKWDKTSSNLTKDDEGKYNNREWQINDAFSNNTEFEVTIENNKLMVKCESGQVMAKNGYKS